MRDSFTGLLTAVVPLPARVVSARRLWYSRVLYATTRSWHQYRVLLSCGHSSHALLARPLFNCALLVNSQHVDLVPNENSSTLIKSSALVFLWPQLVSVMDPSMRTSSLSVNR